MKNLLFAILLTTLCVSTSKITAQSKDSLKIAPYQVKNVYQGLKQGEQYKIQYYNCLEASVKLDSIIQAGHKRTIDFTSNINVLNQHITDQQNQLLKQSVEYEKLKNKKIPWYIHPFTFFSLGFAGGFLIR